MNQLVYLFLGLLAVLATAATFARLDPETRTLTALFAMVSWALWGVHSFDVTTVSNGVRVTDAYFSLAILGLAAAAIMLLTAVRLAFGLVSSSGELGGEFDPNAR